jgi:hypothetical protein
MLGCTIQPLDRCANSTRHTLELVDVHYFFGKLVEPLSYKYPLLLQFSHILSGPQSTKILPLCVFCEFVSFQS